MSKRRFVLVFHPEKASGLGEFGADIASNPPATLEGILYVRNLISTIEQHGPFAEIYCSRLCRTSGPVSVLALHFDLDFHSKKGLGQHGSKDGDTVYMYPGCEQESWGDWKSAAVDAIHEIIDETLDKETILVMAHRPTIAGIICHARRLSDINEAKHLASDPDFVKYGFVVMDVEDDQFIEVEI